MTCWGLGNDGFTWLGKYKIKLIGLIYGPH